MPTSPQKTLLLVDGSNQFIRHWTAHGAKDPNGNRMGGVVGVLRDLSYYVGWLHPDQVVITFDAPGGSTRRRKMCSEYKAGRKPPRINSEFQQSPEMNAANRKAQFQRLLEYLHDLPVTVLQIPGIEADDAIAYICHPLRKDEQKIIVSNDQDFNQLLDHNTKIYRPTKKMFYGFDDCLTEHEIHPNNFAIARAFVGDTSDNLPGIPRIGLKTLRKLVPQLQNAAKLSVDDVLNFCSQQDDAKYKLFAEHKELVAGNYQVMQLRDPIISLASIQLIRTAISEHQGMSATGIRTKLIKHGIDIGGNTFFTNFLKLSNRR